jgi:hypothetical protein
VADVTGWDECRLDYDAWAKGFCQIANLRHELNGGFEAELKHPVYERFLEQ